MLEQLCVIQKGSMTHPALHVRRSSSRIHLKESLLQVPARKRNLAHHIISTVARYHQRFASGHTFGHSNALGCDPDGMVLAGSSRTEVHGWAACRGLGAPKETICNLAGGRVVEDQRARQ
eukprot:4035874-Prymnesium_polylepis.1